MLIPVLVQYLLCQVTRLLLKRFRRHLQDTLSIGLRPMPLLSQVCIDQEARVVLEQLASPRFP